MIRMNLLNRAVQGGGGMSSQLRAATAILAGSAVAAGGVSVMAGGMMLENKGWTGTEGMQYGGATAALGGTAAMAGGGAAGAVILGMRGGRALGRAGGRMIDRVAGMGRKSASAPWDPSMQGQLVRMEDVNKMNARDPMKGLGPQGTGGVHLGGSATRGGTATKPVFDPKRGENIHVPLDTVVRSGSASASNAGVGAGGGAMTDAVAQSSGIGAALISGQGMAGAIGMGAVGAGVSWATGGEASQGAAFGLGMGFAARGLFTTEAVRGLGKAITSNERFAADGMVNRFGSWASEATVNSRAMALSGAGLGGVMFGGSNKPPSHARGFNQHRGNGF